MMGAIASGTEGKRLRFDNLIAENGLTVGRVRSYTSKEKRPVRREPRGVEMWTRTLGNNHSRESLWCLLQRPRMGFIISSRSAAAPH